MEYYLGGTWSNLHLWVYWRRFRPFLGGAHPHVGHCSTCSMEKKHFCIFALSNVDKNNCLINAMMVPIPHTEKG